MGFLEKLNEKKKKIQEDIEQGKIITEQKRAERLRKKTNKIADMKPGARRAITEGFAMKKTTMQVMREEYERRKELRKQHEKRDP